MQSDVKIKENADWYYANQDDLVSKYKGKYVAISDCGVVGSFDTFKIKLKRSLVKSLQKV